MLKCDFHLHCKGDPEDNYIKYSAKEYIDRASKLGFNALSFTNHHAVFNIKPLQGYARRKGIVLIPGTEAKIEGKDVLLYNFTQEEVAKIKTFDDLRAIKSERHLVIAPHPFYPHLEPPAFKNRAISRRLFENVDLFDGLEFCHLHTSHLGFNYKTVFAAKKHKLAVVGNSDAHNPCHMGTTYSLIDAKPSAGAIINAVKQRKVEHISMPRSFFSCIRILLSHAKHIKLNRKTYKCF